MRIISLVIVLALANYIRCENDIKDEEVPTQRLRGLGESIIGSIFGHTNDKVDSSHSSIKDQLTETISTNGLQDVAVDNDNTVMDNTNTDESYDDESYDDENEPMDALTTGDSNTSNTAINLFVKQGIMDGNDDQGYDDQGYEDQSPFVNLQARWRSNNDGESMGAFNYKGVINQLLNSGDDDYVNGDDQNDDQRNDDQRYDDQGYDDQGYDDQGYDDRGYDDQGYDDEGYDDQGPIARVAGVIGAIKDHHDNRNHRQLVNDGTIAPICSCENCASSPEDYLFRWRRGFLGNYGISCVSSCLYGNIGSTILTYDLLRSFKYLDAPKYDLANVFGNDALLVFAALRRDMFSSDKYGVINGVVAGLADSPAPNKIVGSRATFETVL